MRCNDSYGDQWQCHCTTIYCRVRRTGLALSQATESSKIYYVGTDPACLRAGKAMCIDASLTAGIWQTSLSVVLDDIWIIGLQSACSLISRKGWWETPEDGGRKHHGNTNHKTLRNTIIFKVLFFPFVIAIDIYEHQYTSLGKIPTTATIFTGRLFINYCLLILLFRCLRACMPICEVIRFGQHKNRTGQRQAAGVDREMMTRRKEWTPTYLRYRGPWNVWRWLWHYEVYEICTYLRVCIVIAEKEYTRISIYVSPTWCHSYWTALRDVRAYTVLEWHAGLDGRVVRHTGSVTVIQALVTFLVTSTTNMIDSPSRRCSTSYDKQ